MTLPKIQSPIFDLTIPSTKKKVKFRPFLVAEEKILLFALESNDPNSMSQASAQIINNCLLDKVDVMKLTNIDIEYMLLKIRSKSVNNIAKVAFVDHEDEQKYNFEINLDEIEVTYPNGEPEPKIKINDEVGIILKLPTFGDAMNIPNDPNLDPTIEAIRLSIDTVFDSEKVYPFNEESREEQLKFIESFPLGVFDSINKFFESCPKLEHVIKYKNSLGSERTIKLNGVRDFFSWR